MAFHLERSYINNIGNTKRKPSAKLIKAQQEHDKYLRSQGLHPQQLAARTPNQPRKLSHSVSADKSGPQVSNGFAPGGAKRSVFDTEWNRTYDHDPAMAEREAAALAEAEAKKSRVMQTYNKGPVMFAGDLKMTELGKRR